MVRKYKKKTKRASISEEDIKRAMEEVLTHKVSVRNAAARYNICKSTLFLRLKKKVKKSICDHVNDSGNDTDVEAGASADQRSKYASRQVFTVTEEKELEEYLVRSSEIHYGLTYRNARKLAYEFAVRLNKKFPQKWTQTGLAGEDWMWSFMQRHRNLSYRKPENTSLQRASAFNQANVTRFFDNYLEVQQKFKFRPEKIFNLDETGIPTVLQAPKVIAPTGKKQVGQIVSAERGTLVTFCGIVSAAGVSLPPVYIFPRKKVKEFMFGAPIGSIGLGSPNGWITSELFLEVLQHIQIHTNPTVDNPLLLIIDNHKSHVSLAAISFCRANNITLLSFPPHCTHKMQPLDVGLYGPFKSRCKVAFNDYLAANGAKTIKISDIPRLTCTPYLQTFAPYNITKAFKTTGIWPINRFVYGPEDFSSSYVTDRPQFEDSLPLDNMISNQNERPSTSGVESTEHLAKFILDIILEAVFTDSAKTKPRCASLIDIRPYPKAEPRKQMRKSRGKKSTVYTSTPEKNIIEQLEAERKQKPVKNAKRAVFRKTEKKECERKPVQKKQKKEIEEVSTSDSENSSIVNILSKKTKTFSSSDSDIGMQDDNEDNVLSLLDDDKINIGDFLLIKFPTKKRIRYYIGQVLNVEEADTYEIKFLRKKGSFGFVFPQVDDISTIMRFDVVAKLPKPAEVGKTSRLHSCLKFNLQFDGYQIE